MLASNFPDVLVVGYPDEESCLGHFKEMLEETLAAKEEQEKQLVLDNKVGY